MIKHNRFRDISDINQLEAIEDELLLQVDHSSNEAAKRKLIHLYLRMWELQPESDRYELSLSKLYLGLGWDLKKQRVNYEEAIKFFKKVIELKRPMIVPIAHYRLAFIYYYLKKWDLAIKNFNEALRNSSRELDEKWAKLTDSHRFKASVRLALACKYKSIEVAKDAKLLYGNILKFDESNLSYYQELEGILIEERFPYLCITPSGSEKISERAFEELKDQVDTVVLDYREYGHKYLCVEGACYLIRSSRNVEILKKLLQSSVPISQARLERELNIRQVSVYMNRLRIFLTECGLDQNAIITNNGYKWNQPNTYLVYRSDDPEYMF